MSRIGKTEAETLVELFNQIYKVGSKVSWMLWANDKTSIQELTVREPAYIANNGIPVTFFKEKSGYCSIESRHLIYPMIHLCDDNPKNTLVIPISEKEAETYSGQCSFDDDGHHFDDEGNPITVCRYCNKSYRQ